jgi:hypothetical protein
MEGTRPQLLHSNQQQQEYQVSTTDGCSCRTRQLYQSYELKLFKDNNISKLSQHSNLPISLPCFRLPFWNFANVGRTHHKTLLTTRTACYLCGLNETDEYDYEEDNSESDECANIWRPKSDLIKSHFNIRLDDDSTVSTTIASDGYMYDKVDPDLYGNHVTLGTAQPRQHQQHCADMRYVSLKSLIQAEKEKSSIVESCVPCAKEGNTGKKLLFRCDRCKTQLLDDWRFCPTCGVYIDVQDISFVKN